MEITLTPELERLINEEIQSGNFDSPNEVLRESLLMFKESRMPKQVRLENLRREVQKGIDAVRNGQYTNYSTDELDDFVAEVIDRGIKKLNRNDGEKNG